MKIIQHFVKLTISAAILFLLVNPGAAQTAPQQEKLLNGLKLLTWRQKGADKVSVKLRLHSGSSFDPQNKEGVMALFADILFPNQQQVKEFFAEELNGSFEIVSNYDYIQINATGDNDKLLTILDTLAQAVTQPQIDKETTPKVKLARLAQNKRIGNKSGIHRRFSRPAATARRFSIRQSAERNNGKSGKNRFCRSDFRAGKIFDRR